MVDNNILRNEEKAIFALRELYGKYGYKPFKMSKFEEYEFYIRNKDFLVSDRFITFNDTNGKLMALKPDVTLSIIKNGEDQKGVKQKVFYNENVYRATENGGRYKEIMQAGLECIGDLDLYDVYETVNLAAESLALISSDFALEISHLGILSRLLTFACNDEAFSKRAIGCISSKNAHDLSRLCEEFGVEEKCAKILCEFVGVYGKRSEVLAKLQELCGEIAKNELYELEIISKLLENSKYSDKIVFDFSAINDMNYYNGIVFKGFISGIAEGILAGGQYDKLMSKLDRKAGAVGFAVYLDLLEQLSGADNSYDLDILLIYEEGCAADSVAAAVAKLSSSGESVSAQKAVPEKLRYKKCVKLGKDGSLC